MCAYVCENQNMRYLVWGKSLYIRMSMLVPGILKEIFLSPSTFFLITELRILFFPDHLVHQREQSPEPPQL